LWFSVSATTRPGRAGERDGVDYHFLSDEEFDARLQRDDFLEWFPVFGARYGTPREPIEERLAAGTDVVLDLDVQGALAVRSQHPDAVLVFVRPPSREEQRRRLMARGVDDPEEIDRRLAAAAAEEARAPEFDAIVVNDDIDRVVEQVAGILADRRVTR